MTYLDAASVQEVLDVAQRKRVTDIEHHCQADDFGTSLEVPEGGALGHLTTLGGKVSSLKEFALTAPLRVLSPQVRTAAKTASPNVPVSGLRDRLPRVFRWPILP